MKKITRDSVDAFMNARPFHKDLAFMNARPFRKDNTEVTVLDNLTILF